MWFERNIGGAAPRALACLFQRNGFRVFCLLVKIEPFAGNLAG
jgi:hypothetical protein